MLKAERSAAIFARLRGRKNAAPPGDGPGIATLGGRKFAACLVWYDGDDSGDSLADQARGLSTITHPDSKFMVIRKDIGFGGNGQFGLARESLGVHAWMPSLAATVAGGDADNWLVAICLDDGRWWVGAANERAVIHDGDHIYSDEAAAQRQFRDLRSTRDATRKVYCPAEWDIPDSSDQALDFIAGGDASAALLAPLSGVGSWPAASASMGLRWKVIRAISGRKIINKPTDKTHWGRNICMGIATIGMLGVAFGDDLLELVDPAPKVAPREKAALRDIWAAPWLDAPAPRSFIQSCGAMRAHLDLAAAENWGLQTVKCSNLGTPWREGDAHGVQIDLESRWKREVLGTWGQMIGAVTEHNRLFQDANSVRLANTVDPQVAALDLTERVVARQSRGEPQLWDHDAAIRFLVDWAAFNEAVINFEAETKPDVSEKQQELLRVHNPGVVRALVTMKGGFAPSDFSELIPGLVVVSLAMSTGASDGKSSEIADLQIYYLN